MMENESVEVVTRIYDAVSRGDAATALACLDDDIEWYESVGLPWGGFQRCPGAIAQNVFGPTFQLLPDFMVTPEQIIASDDTVAIVHRYTGTVSGSGRKLDLLGAGVWTVRDGKIVRYRQFVDTVRFLEAVSAEA
jgi:ketosteroid isomerase-like protein